MPAQTRLIIDGLDHDFLQGPMHRALANGSLDTGHMDMGLTSGQVAANVLIPWRVLVDMDAYWKRKEHDVSDTFVIDGKPIAARMKGSLKTGSFTIEY